MKRDSSRCGQKDSNAASRLRSSHGVCQDPETQPTLPCKKLRQRSLQFSDSKQGDRERRRRSMARPSTPAVPTLLFLLFLLTSPISSDAAFSYKQLRSLFSLAHSLVTRVASLRAAKGDLAGSRRAQLLADKLEQGLGLGFWSLMWSMGWDYVRNYAWRDPTASFQALGGVVYDANELLSWLGELSRIGSESEKAAWIARNYRNVVSVSSSLFRRLLSVFRKSGPLREMVETLKQEMEGDFLRDCLEVGSNDLRGLFQILKELALQHTSADSDMEDL